MNIEFCIETSFSLIRRKFPFALFNRSQRQFLSVVKARNKRDAFMVTGLYWTLVTECSLI